MPLARIAGDEWGAVPANSRSAGAFGACKSTVLATAAAKELWIYSKSAGDAKPAIYLDNGSDHPGARIWSNDSGVTCAANQWNAFPMSGSLAFGDDIWIGANSGSGGVLSSSSGGTLRYVVATYSSWASSDPSVALGGTLGETLGFQIYGYVPPTIDTYDPGTGSVTGLDFEIAQGNGKLWLCSSDDFEGATTKIEQTVSAWDDDGISSTPDFTGLSGTAYVFVETDSGQVNTDGKAFTVPSGSGVSATGSGQSPSTGQGTGILSASVSVSASGQTPTVDQSDANAPIHITEILEGAEPVIVGGDAAAGFDFAATGAGQELESVQSDADVVGLGSISTVGAGVELVPGQGDADALIPVTVAADGQEPTTEQGVAAVAIPLSVSGDGSAPAAEQEDAATDLPVSLVVGSGQSATAEQGVASVSIPVFATGEGQSPVVEFGSANVSVGFNVSGSGQSPVIEFGTSGTNISERISGVVIMGKTRTLKYGSTPTLRFNIPSLWDVDSISEIAVSVTNSSGTVLDSGTLTLYTATTLSAAAAKESITVVLASGSSAVYPGDRLRIGGAGEVPEVRTVHAYASSTRTVTLSEELNFDHASGVAVVGMWGTYSLDMSDTDTFKNMMDVWCRFTADTRDPSEVYQCQIVKDAFSASELWEDFEVLYPTEWTVIQSRDLDRLERVALGHLRDDLRKMDMQMDAIQDTAIIQRGLIMKIRLLALMSGGDMSEVEYKRTESVYTTWLQSVSRMEIWEDTDGDQVQDENETTPTAEAFFSQRFY